MYLHCSVTLPSLFSLWNALSGPGSELLLLLRHIANVPYFPISLFIALLIYLLHWGCCATLLYCLYVCLIPSLKCELLREGNLSRSSQYLQDLVQSLVLNTFVELRLLWLCEQSVMGTLRGSSWQKNWQLILLPFADGWKHLPLRASGCKERLNSFIHSLNKYVQNTYYEPGTLLDPGHNSGHTKEYLRPLGHNMLFGGKR